MKEIVITEPVVIPIKPTGKGLLGFASCVVNNAISLNSIAIYSKPNGIGYRLVYPNKTLPNGKDINIYYPISRKASQIINESIFSKYTELLGKATVKIH
ncbi:hypothetical protein ACFL4C_01420 [Candidatus Omnitrophota bacterium]